jgi:hypothetical protein
MYENEIGTVIVDCAIGLYQELGLGLIETVYDAGFRAGRMEEGITRTSYGEL